jgi:hypothetical protein
VARAVTERAIAFHCSGALFTQNRAISVCSGVRYLELTLPSRFTSLRSRA